MMIRLIEPTSGSIRFDGFEITRFSHRHLMPIRRRMQFVFQDPYSSLNPRMTAGQMLSEVIRFHDIVSRSATQSYVEELLETVRLQKDAKDHYPHEFSGGQRQRLNIARALAVKPEFLIADEPVSALDVSVQAQILNLLMDLREQFHLTIMFISHDLKVVEHFCDRMMVMYLGTVAEELACDDIHRDAKHPYTQALLKSNPINDPAERREEFMLEGEIPSAMHPPIGCPFVTRCSIAEHQCHLRRPPLIVHPNNQRVACWAIEPEPAAITGGSQ
ncbi:MAG: ATP-binding cassette domain-containing protein [Planctomycetaceae bacterium]